MPSYEDGHPALSRQQSGIWAGGHERIPRCYVVAAMAGVMAEAMKRRGFSPEA